MSNFIDMCINGKVLMQEIDDFVDQWHEGIADLPLNEFLGMNKLEYKLWVADAEVLPYIITAHKTKTKVTQLVASMEDLPLAARAGNPSSAIKLYKWLEQEGLLDE